MTEYIEDLKNSNILKLLYATLFFFTYSSCTSGKKFIDTRDNNTYRYIALEGNYWMTENIRYNVEGSRLNPDNPNVSYGRLYNWEQAMQACPEGWRLTTNIDWFTIENLVVTTRDSLFITGVPRGHNARILKSKQGWPIPGTDSLQLNILPAGSASHGRFNNLYKTAMFWTSTPPLEVGFSRDKYAYYRVFSNKRAGIFYDYQHKPNHYYSCRCVKSIKPQIE